MDPVDLMVLKTEKTYVDGASFEGTISRAIDICVSYSESIGEPVVTWNETEVAVVRSGGKASGEADEKCPR